MKDPRLAVPTTPPPEHVFPRSSDGGGPKAMPCACGHSEEVSELRRLIAWSDDRLREQAARVGLDIWGCDAPEHMADLILWLRSEVRRLSPGDAVDGAADDDSNNNGREGGTGG
jgi:hypothetical protein